MTLGAQAVVKQESPSVTKQICGACQPMESGVFIAKLVPKEIFLGPCRGLIKWLYL